MNEEDLMGSEEKGYANEKPHITVMAVFFVNQDFHFSSRYSSLFHGQTFLKRGRYKYKYLGEDTTKGRLVQEFVRRHFKNVSLDVQFAGTTTF